MSGNITTNYILCNSGVLIGINDISQQEQNMIKMWGEWVNGVQGVTKYPTITLNSNIDNHPGNVEAGIVIWDGSQNAEDTTMGKICHIKSSGDIWTKGSVFTNYILCNSGLLIGINDISQQEQNMIKMWGEWVNGVQGVTKYPTITLNSNIDNHPGNVEAGIVIWDGSQNAEDTTMGKICHIKSSGDIWTKGSVFANDISVNNITALTISAEDINVNTLTANNMTNSNSPQNDNDLTNKQYVDNQLGISYDIFNVHYATVSGENFKLIYNVPVVGDNSYRLLDNISGGHTNFIGLVADKIDGISHDYTYGSNILVKNQTDDRTNGIYTISANFHIPHDDFRLGSKNFLDFSNILSDISFENLNTSIEKTFEGESVWEGGGMWLLGLSYISDRWIYYIYMWYDGAYGVRGNINKIIVCPRDFIDYNNNNFYKSKYSLNLNQIYNILRHPDQLTPVSYDITKNITLNFSTYAWVDNEWEFSGNMTDVSVSIPFVTSDLSALWDKYDFVDFSHVLVPNTDYSFNIHNNPFVYVEQGSHANQGFNTDVSTVQLFDTSVNFKYMSIIPDNVPNSVTNKMIQTGISGDKIIDNSIDGNKLNIISSSSSSSSSSSVTPLYYDNHTKSLIKDLSNINLQTNGNIHLDASNVIISNSLTVDGSNIMTIITQILARLNALENQ